MGRAYYTEITKYKLGEWAPLVTQVIDSVISERRDHVNGYGIAAKVALCFSAYKYDVSVQERKNLIDHFRANNLSSPWFMVNGVLPDGFSHVHHGVADAIAALMSIPNVANLLVMPFDELQFWVALQEPNRGLIFALRALTDSDKILCNSLLSGLTTMHPVLE